jgi:DNA-directed RNA polymerase subunit B
MIVAGGDLIEDAFIMSRGFVKRGGFSSVTSKIIKEKFKFQKERSFPDGTIIRTIIGNKIPIEIKKRHHPLVHRNLDSRGVIISGSVIKEGDCLLGRYREKILPNGNITYYDLGIYAKKSKIGTVTHVIYNDTDSENIMLNICIQQAHTPEVGDKFSPSHAQKGTIGKIVDDADMIYSLSGASKGMRPDIAIDIHAFPSRMTIGMILEIILSKVAILVDDRVNATAMKNNELREQVLKDAGYVAYRKGDIAGSKELVFNPLTGTVFRVPIAAGPCYYYSLVHESGPKVQNRYTGAYKRSTGQSVTGIDNDGGQRNGEMEFEALHAHGNAYMIQNFATRSADYKILYTCRRCDTQVYRGVGNVYHCPICRKPADLLFAESTNTGQVLKNYEEGFGVKTTYTLEPI